jgi:lipopolysaccharide heptosyltransferase II
MVAWLFTSSRPLKVLILKPSSLGDVVQALPVLRLLKAHEPGSQVYWWISSDLRELLQDDPDLTGIFPFERRGWTQPRTWSQFFRNIREMRALRFDWVIDLQSLARSGVVGWLAHGGLSIGLDDRREGAPAFYDLAVPRPSPLTHAVDWYLKVLETLHVPVHWDFVWIPPRLQVAKAIRRKWSIEPGRPIILLSPGARWVNKRWPIHFYAEVIRTLAAERADLRFAVLGSNSDADLGAVLAQAVPGRCLDLTGRTTLPEMVEWIRLSALVLSNDTGPMHVAAALGKPVVALFGPTEPRRTGPFRQMENVLRLPLPCAPCLTPHCHFSKPLECLRGLSPAIVCGKAREVLNTRGGHGVD